MIDTLVMGLRLMRFRGNSFPMNTTSLTRRKFGQLTGAAALGFVWARLEWSVASSLPPLRIAFYTDVHAMPDLTDGASLDRAAAAINASGADAIIAGGDMIHRGHVSAAADCPPRFALYKEFLSKLPPGVEHVPGNHDLAGARPQDGSPATDNPWGLWSEQLGISQINRSFERAGYTFIILDTLEIVPEKAVYRGCTGPDRLAWLRAEVESAPSDQPLILCLHIPVVSKFVDSRTAAGETPSPSLQVTDAEEIFRIFSHRKLAAVLQGHVHVKERMDANGVPVLTGGAIAGAWWKGENEGTPRGFARIEIKDGKLTWEYIAT